MRRAMRCSTAPVWQAVGGFAVEQAQREARLLARVAVVAPRTTRRAGRRSTGRRGRCRAGRSGRPAAGRPDRAWVSPAPLALAVADGVARRQRSVSRRWRAGGRLAEDVQAVGGSGFPSSSQRYASMRRAARVVVGRGRRRSSWCSWCARTRATICARSTAARARVDEQRVVVLIDLPLEVPQRAVAVGARQRRHQVVDDHRLGAALGLRAFAGVVDDERVQVRHRAQHHVGPAGRRRGPGSCPAAIRGCRACRRAPSRPSRRCRAASSRRRGSQCGGTRSASW